MIKSIFYTGFLVGALAFFTLPGNAQEVKVPKSIKVQGTVEFLSPQTPNRVYLLGVSIAGKGEKIDSVVVDENNKSFSFVLNQDHPGIYNVNAFGWDQASFWSDADVNMNLRGYDTAAMKIKIPHYNFVEGSWDNNFINLYNQLGDLNYLRMVDELNEEYYAKQHQEKDSAWITYLKTRKQYDTLHVDYQKRLDVLMKVFENRPVLIYALRGSVGPNQKNYDRAMGILDNLIKRYPWLTEAQEAKRGITENMELALRLQPGQPVPHISYPDDKGKNQSLEKYSGKYVLMDFWASWCGPCRAAVPKVKELYSQYHKEGLEVVSISIDDDKAAWRKAMKDEQMPWEQLLSPDKEVTMKTFQFGGIPTLYLVDPNGNIVGRYLGYSSDSEAEIKSIIETKQMAPEIKKTIPASGMMSAPSTTTDKKPAPSKPKKAVPMTQM